MSILSSLKEMATSQLINGVASHLGESNEGVSKAMTGIMPSLLGSLMNSKQEDHGMLSGLLSQAGNLGGGDLVGSLLGGLTGGNTNTGVSGIGSSLVSGLLGNKMGGVVDLVSKFAGVKSSSSSSLMGIGGSLIASFLGKKMLGGLDFGGIMNFLGGHKDEIGKAMPAGFASSFGLGNMFGNVTETISNAASTVTGAASAVTGAAAGAVSSAANTAANIGGAITGGGNDDNNSGGGMKWLWPLLLLLGLGLLAMWAYKSCNKGTDEHASTEPATEQTSGGTGAVADSNHGANAAPTNDTVRMDAAKPQSIKVKLPNGVELDANSGGVEDNLVKFLNDPASKLAGDADPSKDWYDFDNLNFDLGKATITKESMVQVDNLAKILKAYPNLQIKIGGYTDRKGDDNGNLKLSQNRADAVQKALLAKGANAAQIKGAEGYGEKFANVAESASDEERRKDRRTAVRVLAK